jgi:hypothetical protein
MRFRTSVLRLRFAPDISFSRISLSNYFRRAALAYRSVQLECHSARHQRRRYDFPDTLARRRRRRYCL